MLSFGYSMISNIRACAARPVYDLSLYVIANRETFPVTDVLLDRVRRAVDAGGSCIQYRDHVSDFAELVQTTARLKQLAQGLPVFINTPDPIRLARAVEVDGVFLEDEGLFRPVRQQLGPDSVIGLEVKSTDDVIVAASTEGVDYLSVKVASLTRSPGMLWGVGGLKGVRLVSPQRIVAIGGMTPALAERVYQVLREDDGIAMGGDLLSREDLTTFARAIIRARYND